MRVAGRHDTVSTYAETPVSDELFAGVVELSLISIYAWALSSNTVMTRIVGVLIEGEMDWKWSLSLRTYRHDEGPCLLL